MTTATRYVILDDDPTGSQEASDVAVLLELDSARLEAALEHDEVVYAVTNTRSLVESDAVALLSRLRAALDEIAARRGWSIRVVQRGDSTLRGHVFPEIDVFAGPGSRVVLAPAFPAGGRRTRGGVHEIRDEDGWRNVADTEFARDPVFGFGERDLIAYVRAHGDRDARTVDAPGLAAALAAPADGAVLALDAESDAELEAAAAVIREAWARGVDVVVRTAAPLAAYLAGRKSEGRVHPSHRHRAAPVLVVAGSHTAATTAQLAELLSRWPEHVELDAELAIADPAAAASAVVAPLRAALARAPLVTLATTRLRRREHGTLADGERVMDALTRAVAAVRDTAGAVIAKGGITSAEVARRGLGGERARVVGQLQAGISLWEIPGAEGRERSYVVVPGNVGGPDTLVQIAAELVDR